MGDGKGRRGTVEVYEIWVEGGNRVVISNDRMRRKRLRNTSNRELFYLFREQGSYAFRLLKVVGSQIAEFRVRLYQGTNGTQWRKVGGDKKRE